MPLAAFTNPGHPEEGLSSSKTRLEGPHLGARPIHLPPHGRLRDPEEGRRQDRQRRLRAAHVRV